MLQKTALSTCSKEKTHGARPYITTEGRRITRRVKQRPGTRRHLLKWLLLEDANAAHSKFDLCGKCDKKIALAL